MNDTPPIRICPTCNGNRMIARVFFVRPWIRWVTCQRCHGKGTV